MSTYNTNSNIGLIHLDIEGSELKALKGAKKLLSLPEHEAPELIFEYCTYFHKAKNKINKIAVIFILIKTPTQEIFWKHTLTYPNLHKHNQAVSPNAFDKTYLLHHQA